MIQLAPSGAPTEPPKSLNGTDNASILDNIASDQKALSEDERAVIAVRSLAFDITHQNGGGHGGSAVGMAAIGVALWKYIMRYNPSDPDWIDRDRFILSNGHASMFLYIMNYLTGFDNWTMDELKGYGAAKEDGFTTISHAHPEREVPGVEMTTGPLGQGIANAVGLAIASKNLGAGFNKGQFSPFTSRVYCMTGDGCLMEGVALEAISLAGHLKLNNLILIYDNNSVTCDGPLDWINSEDTNRKMRACGWHTIDVFGGAHDVQAIVAGLKQAKLISDKPVFINIRTVIGVGTLVAGTAKAHHGLFDTASIEASKRLIGIDPRSTHTVPETILEYFRERKTHGKMLQREWNQMLVKYREAFPHEAEQVLSRMTGELDKTVSQQLANLNSVDLRGLATREINGIVLERLWEWCPAMIGGGADLVNSNKVKYHESDVFDPATGFQGRFIRYGIREHAMCAISNGLAGFAPGVFIPVTATFLMFYLYGAPAVRMGALSGLRVIHCATHDSFAEGQNGPTHQPVELDSLLRAMPNLTYIRPSDAEEVIGAWQYSLANSHGSSMISLARDPTAPIPNTDRNKVSKGCYVIQEDENACITLASCGSNLHYAVAAAKMLEEGGFPARIVSAPSLDIFALQDIGYQRTVFPTDGRPIVSIEEYVPTVWARYVTASIGMTGYGYSASSKSNYRRFGLDAESIVEKCLGYLKKIGKANARTFGWQQL